jgi:hypothetical protein
MKYRILLANRDSAEPLEHWFNTHDFEGAMVRYEEEDCSIDNWGEPQMAILTLPEGKDCKMLFERLSNWIRNYRELS